MKRILAGLLVAAAVSASPAFAQQSTPTAQPPSSRGRTIDGVAATVNDQIISYSDVRTRTRWMLLKFKEQPNDQVLAEIFKQAEESLIEEKVELNEFHKLVKDEKIKPDEIDERIDDLARQYKMNREQFTMALGESGIPVQHIRDMMEAEIAWTALIRGRYAKSVRVSDLRINEMLQRIQNSLNKPQYKLAEIFLYAPDQASKDKALVRANTLIDSINKGADFQAIAQQFSAAPSASQGGDLNWISPGDMRSPEIEAAVAAAGKPPVVLPPIESEGGIYIIAVTGKREASDPAMSVILNLKQVVARGEGAAAKLQAAKAKAPGCGDVAKAIDGVDGLTANDMKDVGLRQVAPAFRGQLEALDANQSTDLIDMPDGAKMVFYVCEKHSGDPDLPTRDEIKDRLFNSELTLVAERYLRDLKREASIQRR